VKRSLIVFSMLCAFLIVVLAYGYSLPVEHKTTMQRHYDKKADELWDIIVDYRKYSQWRQNVYEVNEMPAKGVYEAWKEVDANGRSVAFEIVGYLPGVQMIIEMTDTTLPYGGSWTFDLLPDATGTVVKITENGKIDNLVLRVIAHLVTGYTSSMNAWLNSLDNKFALESRMAKSAVDKAAAVETMQSVVTDYDKDK
jgi:Polyketide cyclase / dehydrase and lipid transport